MGGLNGLQSNLKSTVGLHLTIPNTPRYTELNNLYNTRLANTDGGLNGSRYFWTSDWLSHNRSGYHIGVKTNSTRTRPGERITGENLLGLFLNDGATVIQRNGDEYDDNVFPVLDWNKIPGTTTLNGDSPAIPYYNYYTKGKTSFVGGASDGTYSCSAMDYSRNGLTGKKAWFMFDEGMMALGTGITTATAMNPFTTVNQCKKVGSVTMSDGTTISTLSAGTITANPLWVMHDNVGYIFPSRPSINIKNDVQTGKWTDINTTVSDSSIHSTNIFSAWFDHGNRPNNASYNYMVVVGKNQSELDNYGRVGSDGKLRDLHIDKSIDVSNLSKVIPSGKPQGETVICDGYTLTLLVGCEYFNVTRLDVDTKAKLVASAISFISLLFLSDIGVVKYENTELKCKKGDSIFIPANMGEFIIEGKTSLILSTIEGVKKFCRWHGEFCVNINFFQAIINIFTVDFAKNLSWGFARNNFFSRW